jgi:hypothetical protein
MNMSRILLAIVVVGIGDVGCGGDGSPSSAGGAGSGAGGASGACTAVTACGGDLTGDWKVIDVCVDQTSLDSQAAQVCDNAKLALSSPKVTGSISYKADKTYAQAASTADATVTFTLGSTCLKQGSTTFTCDQIQTQLNTDASNPPTTCTSSSDGGCKCVSIVHQELMSTGTYAISGNSVTLTAGADVSKQDYCVKGDKLYLLPTADSTLPGQLEFQKQ